MATFGATDEDVDLCNAVVFGDPDAATSAILRGANPDKLSGCLGERTDNGTLEKNPFRIACYLGDADVARCLIDAGADPNYRDGDGEPLIAYAARTNDLALCQFLLDHGADINARGDDGYAAIEYAFLGVSSSNAEDDLAVAETVAFLLENGAVITPITLTAAMTGYNEDGYCKYTLVRDVLQDLLSSGQDSGLPSLLEAAILGDSAAVRQLVGSGEYTRLSPDNRDRVLFYVAALGDVATLQLLFDRGASIDSCDGVGNSLLAIAARSGNVETLDYLISQGLSLRARNWDGYTPLELAVVCGQVEAAGALLDVCAKSGSAWQPSGDQDRIVDVLVLASGNGDLQMVTLLIEKGYPLSGIPGGMQAAVERDCVRVLKYLMDLEGPSDLTTADEAALEGACRCGSMASVEYLVAGGADVNGTGQGEPLRAACRANEVAIAAYLLEHGADTSLADSSAYADPLLCVAIAEGASAIVDLLLEHGVSAALPVGYEDTALTTAVKWGSAMDVESLLEHGASIDAQDADGRTPLILAARNGNVEMVRMLLAAGADTRVIDEGGCTALTILKLRNARTIEDLLRSAEDD